MAQRPELWGAASKWRSEDLSLEPVTPSCKSLFGSALGPCAVNKWGVYDVHPSQPWVLLCLLWSGHESPSPHDHLSGPCSSLGVLFISGHGAGLSYKIWFPNVAGKKKKSSSSSKAVKTFGGSRTHSKLIPHRTSHKERILSEMHCLTTACLF